MNVIGVNDRPILRFGGDRESYSSNSVHLVRRRIYTSTPDGTALFPSDLIVNDVDSPNLAGASILLFGHLEDQASDYLRVDQSLLQRNNVTFVTSSAPFKKLSFTGTAPVAIYEKAISFETNCLWLANLSLQILRSVHFVYHSTGHGENPHVIIKASVVDDLDAVFVLMQIP